MFNLLKINRFIFSITLLMLFNLTQTIAASDESYPDEFIISLSHWPSTLDPQLRRNQPVFNIAYHLYDPLFLLKDNGEYYSEILDSYEAKNKKQWIFKLKPNIKFHDKSPLTTKDIIYTFNRILNNNSLAFKGFLSEFESYTEIDDLTLEIKTKNPHPTIMRDLYRLPIMKYRSSFSTSDNFLASKSYIGTGPYMFDEITTNGDIKLIRNPHYHQEKPFIKRVKFVKKPATLKEQEKAIKQGDIHLQDWVQSSDEGIIRNHNNFKILKRLSHRLFFLIMDQHSDTSPYIIGKNGKPLKNNPLKELNIRKAISYAINRKELVNTVLLGNAKAAGQLMLDDVIGSNSVLKVDKWDIDKAKELLSKSGYPNGFDLIAPSTNEITGWEDVNYFLIQQLKKININLRLENLTKIDFYKRTKNSDFPIALFSISTKGDVKGMVNVLLHTPNESSGRFNTGKYSNKEVDALIDQGNSDFNEVRRVSLYRKATEIAISDLAIIPLYFTERLWAINSDKGVDFWAYRNGYTLAKNIRKIITPNK